jgi:hypothetical protein
LVVNILEYLSFIGSSSLIVLIEYAAVMGLFLALCCISSCSEKVVVVLLRLNMS